MTTFEQLTETYCDNFINSYRAHSSHFNIVGQEFYSWHKLLQKIYEDSESIQDDLGELIRALGEFAPETIHDILNLADLQDVQTGSSAQDLLELVLDGQEHMINSYRKLMDVANQEGHEDIGNFAQDRIRQHKKFAWMLQSSLDLSHQA
jgi:starvation-inducible DNA-binding protein